MRSIAGLSLLLCLVATPAAQAGHGPDYFFVGGTAGLLTDFYTETNWDTNPAATPGTGNLLANEGNVLFDSSVNEIQIHLVIDDAGDAVTAAGNVDIGRSDGTGDGSLRIVDGSLTLSSTTGDFDYNQGADKFEFTGGTLDVTDDIFFQAADYDFNGGSVLSRTDDIQFENEINSLIINGTSFSSGVDNSGSTAQIFFEFGLNGTVTSGNTGTSTHSISNASFDTGAAKFGIRFGLDLTVTDTDINVADGLNDVENSFSSNNSDTTDRLTLLGASTLLANAVEDGIDLVLGGTSTASLGANGTAILAANPNDAANTSRILFTSLDSKLTVSSAITTDPRTLIINGLTGQSYLQAPEQWNIETWNGLDAITDLQIDTVPEPSSLVLASLFFVAAAASRRRRLG